MRTCKQGVLAQPLNSLGARKQGAPCRYIDTHFSFMPTKRDRVQVLLLPSEFAKVKPLARHNRCTLSKMGALLCQAAMELPQFRKQLAHADLKYGPKADPVEATPLHHYKPEPRTRRQPQTPEPVRVDPWWRS